MSRRSPFASPITKEPQAGLVEITAVTARTQAETETTPGRMPQLCVEFAGSARLVRFLLIAAAGLFLRPTVRAERRTWPLPLPTYRRPELAIDFAGLLLPAQPTSGPD